MTESTGSNACAEAAAQLGEQNHDSFGARKKSLGFAEIAVYGGAAIVRRYLLSAAPLFGLRDELELLLADETGLSRANRENPRLNKLLGSGLAVGTEQ